MLPSSTCTSGEFFIIPNYDAGWWKITSLTETVARNCANLNKN